MELWTDRKVDQLPSLGKLLFVYLITNPHTHLCGIYYLPKAMMVEETKISERICDTLFDTLSRAELAWYDAENKVVFVKRMFTYQGKGQKNHYAAAHHLQSLHHSPLIRQFLHVYPMIADICKDRGYCPWLDTLSDTLSIPYPDLPVPDPVLLISSPNPEGEKIVKKRGGNGKHPWSDDLQPSEKHHRLAKEWGVDLGFEWGKFKNYCLSHGKGYVDYEATFRNWLAGAYERKGKGHAL